MQEFDFYIEPLTENTNSYELKTFRVQHDEGQLTDYLKKFAKKHQASKVNKIYLVRYSSTGQIAVWFGLKAACKALFLFAIDTPKLIKYYKDILKFKEITNTNEKQFFEYAAPDYDEGCRFFYGKNYLIE